jgi:hypothetical protein
MSYYVDHMYLLPVMAYICKYSTVYVQMLILIRKSCKKVLLNGYYSVKVKEYPIYSTFCTSLKSSRLSNFIFNFFDGTYNSVTFFVFYTHR